MAVHDFDGVNVAVSPLKANSPLIVDAYAVLPVAVALQAFQPVSRQVRERLQVGRRIQDIQFSQGGSLDGLEPADRFTTEEALGVRAAERPDHTIMLYCFPLHVNQYKSESTGLKNQTPERSLRLLRFSENVL